jgi:hypothetical protein
MKKRSKKEFIFYSIIIIIFIIGIVPREFQNDTFFNISIGKYILENGIDMQEHWAFTQGLTYTFSHWAFDIITYLIYNLYNFKGIYIFTIIISILIYISLFYCLTKKSDKPILSLLLVLIFSYFLSHSFTARSQIISFVCFIIEIYCIEQFIETNKKKYCIILLLLSIIIANFHAATWPLFLVLFMPYIGAAFINYISAKNIFTLLIKRDKKKLKNLSEESPKYNYYKEDLEIYTRLLKKENNKKEFKITRKSFYNIKNLIILIIIIMLSGLLTPIHGTPYTYIIKSMFGPSNFGELKSIAYIAEMQPIIPVNHESLIIFMIIFIVFLTFYPTKIKLEHIFLLLGLLYMTLSSNRYLYLLVPLGCYVLCDLLTQCSDIYFKKEMNILEKILIHPISVVICIISVCIFTIYNINMIKDIDFVNEELYPTLATKYIKENLDYKNIRIYNSYNFGSYLMLNDIPVFIDSRLDVYCSEFNDTDIFYDYVKAANGQVYYEEVFEKYDFTHILLYDDEVMNIYIKNDNNYKLLYEDENFSLYERNTK